MLRWAAALALILSLAVPSLAFANSGGPDEGIHVSGQWTIDVINPDGSIDSHTEFENSLTSTGGAMLLRLLNRNESVGYWAVDFGGSPNCNGNPLYRLVEASYPNGTNGACGNTSLTVSVPTSGPNVGMLDLEGTYTVPSTGQITYVQTDLFACAYGAGGPTCPVVEANSFTHFDLLSPIAVGDGQEVQVRVLISFS